MSRYDWPGSETSTPRDDPAGRARFLLPRRTDFDPQGALAASRGARTTGRPRPGVPAAAPSGRSLLWLPMGPATIVHGQATGAPRVAGRVRAIAVHRDGERIYAAAANGGVWHSGDAGESWTNIGGFAGTPAPLPNRPSHRHSCGAIFVRFDDSGPGGDFVVVGTGEHGDRSVQPGGHLRGIGMLSATGPAASASTDPWTLEATDEFKDHAVYRFAEDPGGTTLVAATTKGLFQRGAGVPATWGRVSGTPFSTFDGVCTDVLWTAATTTAPKRLWAWIQSGSDRGLWVRPDGATDFSPVATPGSHDTRAVIGATTPPDTAYVFNHRYHAPGTSTVASAAPILFQVDASTDALPTARAVAGVPDMLGAQGDYDLAIAVGPNDPAVVVLGGSAIKDVNPAGLQYPDYDASLYSGTVAMVGTTLTYRSPTLIGVGAHPDVHVLTFAKGGTRLFLGCDGGVYRSDHPTKQVGFVACSNGLQISQTNYLATHPKCEGRIVSGLQDNGTIEYVSGGVWRSVSGSDGGGVVFDPVHLDRHVHQFYTGLWTGGNGFHNLLKRGPTLLAGAATEQSAAAFYATPAAVKHTRGSGPAATEVGQVLIPTTRVWYTEDFGSTFVTLPTGTDPITPATYDGTQDDIGEEILVCEWQSADVAWVLSKSQLRRLARTPGSDNGGPPGTWTAPLILKKGVKDKKDETSAEGPIRDADVWTDIAVNLEADGSQHAAKGALYLATSGHPDKTDVDTLWWFDGIETWHPTGLRGTVPAPVTAVLADPATPNTVYAGTTVGVWRGVQTLHSGAAPTWAWEALLNGLPEACVEDLALFDDAGIRLLRAAIVARGVWQLRLDADVEDVTYVRAHDDDLRVRRSAVEVQRDLVTARSWHGSPDVLPRVVPTLVVPTDFPWSFAKKPTVESQLRRFQAALRSKFSDPRFRATGEWSLHFEEVLRDRGAPVVGNRVVVDQPYWQTIMQPPHSTAEAWGTEAPTEADLCDFTPRLSEGSLAAASLTMPATAAKVDVLVHRRGLDPIDGGQVRVVLLRWVDPATHHSASASDSTTWFSGNVPWTAAVDEVLNSAGGATGQSLGSGWEFMGTTAAARRKMLSAQTLDNTTTGIATFDLDLSGLAVSRVVLLVAVIRADGPSAIAPGTLRDKALKDPHVAVRSLRIGT